MPAPHTGVDVGSTIAALARTLDSQALREQLGVTTVPAPGDGASGDAELAALELGGAARYQDLSELGAGGMGRVDAVWDGDLMRELALKQLHPRLAGDGRSLRQFLWEARVTAHLDHPNIIPVHDLGLDGSGRLYFTMKRVRGRSLAQLCELLAALEPARFAELEQHQRVEAEPDEDPAIAEFGPRRRRLRVFVEICQAVAYAHERGVLHRDLKPANAMLGEFGEVLVMDWGLARPIPDRGDTVLDELMPQELQDEGGALYGTPRYMAPELLRGALYGTPRYMAPELLRGEPADVRTDVYALGVMLYELLALRQPHEAESVPALVLKITEGESTPLQDIAPQLPRSIVAVVEQAMATDASRRYANVAELIEDVEAVLDGLTPVAEQASHLTKVHRYFTSRDNPDTAHLRLVDLDLTAGAGICAGVAGTLVALQGMSWLPLVVFGVGLALFAMPLRAYMRVMGRGKRRLERERARAHGPNS